jgi:hypothetical protein
MKIFLQLANISGALLERIPTSEQFTSKNIAGWSRMAHVTLAYLLLSVEHEVMDLEDNNVNNQNSRYTKSRLELIIAPEQKAIIKMYAERVVE